MRVLIALHQYLPDHFAGTEQLTRKVARSLASRGDEVMIVESPKAAASVYAPVSGEVVEVNADLEASPGTINASPYEGGWLVKIRPSAFAAEKSSLLSHDDYQTKVAEA